MKSLSNNKGLISIVIIIIIGFFVYRSFLGGGVEMVDTGSANVGSEVVAMYDSLQAVTLDQTIFSSSAYRSLVDFSTVLVPQPTGRRNPFNIIGAE